MCDPAGVGPGRWILFLLRFDPSGVGLRLKIIILLYNVMMEMMCDANGLMNGGFCFYKYATLTGSDHG